MTGPFSIGPAAQADAAAIADIYAHHVLHGVATFETVPPDAVEMARRMDGVLAGGFPWLAARDASGALAGYAYAGPFHPRAAYRLTCEDSIYLRPDAMGQGLGTTLLAELIARCEGAGLRQMIALIAAEEPASIALHRRFGFAHAGALENVGRKFGRWLGVVYMQRALGAGANTPPVEEPA